MGKRVQVIQDEKGKFEKRICEACHMKMDEEEAKNLQKVNDNNNVQQQGPPPLVIANPNMKCSECNKIIIGNAVKANDNKYYHEQCLKCDKCQAKLANNKYGYINNQKWCSNCIQKKDQKILVILKLMIMVKQKKKNNYKREKYICLNYIN